MYQDILLGLKNKKPQGKSPSRRLWIRRFDNFQNKIQYLSSK